MEIIQVLFKVFSALMVFTALSFTILNITKEIKHNINPKNSLNLNRDKIITYKEYGNINQITLVVFFSLLIYGIILLSLTTVFSYVLANQHGSVYDVLKKIYLSLDSNQYVYIAENGYVTEYPRNLNIVFFPGYPFLAGLLGKIINNYFISSIIVSFLSFALGGSVFYKLIYLEYGKEYARDAIIILCLMPGTFFFMTPMTESLFFLTSVVTVYLIKRKKWFLASLVGCYASFTRITGCLLAIIFVYCLFMEILRTKKTTLFLKILYLLIIAIGPISYLIINYRVFGDPFIFLTYQRDNWHQQFDYFFNTPAYLLKYGVQYISENKITTFFGLTIPNLIVTLGIPLLFAIYGRKVKSEYMLYGLFYFVISTGCTWLLSGPRYMLPLITIPIAITEMTKRNNIVKIILFTIMFLSNISYMFMFVLRYQVW